MGQFQISLCCVMNMKNICVFVLLFLVSHGSAEVDDATLPQWQDLECEKGHKYLFSEEARPWQDAKEECELYGGWLVDIRSQAEANCLMRYGTSLGDCHSYWTDGNDIGHTGVWTHARDNTDVTWFPRIQTCSSGHEQYSVGGDALQFYIGRPRIVNGAYCDRES